jgi:cysteine desulfurase
MADPDLIYLDHNATTPLAPEAWEAMRPFLTENWANPSSGYRFARRAREAVQLARSQVAALIGAEADEIVFTSGGTESSHAAIHSAIALHPDRRHLVTCTTEHDATLRPYDEFAARGYDVSILPVDAEGRIDMAAYEAVLRPGQTALVSLMWANNETGLIHPIDQAAAMAHERGILFHTDAVQAVGKVPIDFSQSRVHYASMSGHKLHAPKGVGVLYVKNTARFQASQLGGGQEAGRRSGTLNVPGIVALGAAAAAAQTHLASHPGAVGELRDIFEAGLRQRLTGVHLHSSQAPRLPNTSNFQLEGVDAQGAIILLDTRHICLSSGSACATGSIKPSHVLTAMGLASRPARETLRVSFSRTSTAAEVDTALEALASAVAKLRMTRA